MHSMRLFRRLKMLALVVALAAAGTVPGLGCSLADIRENIVAGSLDYVSSAATSFWANLIAADDVWASLLGRA